MSGRLDKGRAASKRKRKEKQQQQTTTLIGNKPVCVCVCVSVHLKNKTTLKEPLPTLQVRPPAGVAKQAGQYEWETHSRAHKVPPVSEPLAQAPQAAPGSRLPALRSRAQKERTLTQPGTTAPAAAASSQSPASPSPAAWAVNQARPAPPVGCGDGQSKPSSAAMSSVGLLPIGQLY